ncbi:flagellar protein FlgA [Bifidobacterium lemurum]|uniref:Flagellar protein FlgA n=2 Tax=Bifidobacterium lemurum TaxID=1603886 RepID=A0A261FVA8_9BIFI|nr:SAF domain-containing protein [Bifidobacterium lemurum]OZG63058.1 flagellar protein FlgA [Bifidobacterium lemurum]
MARLRRCLAACCAAAAVCAVISAVISTVATMPVVVARTAIRRGETIAETDVMWADMPVSTTSRLLVDSTALVVGRVAQVDIDVGQPFTTHMARDSPVTPEGHTVIEVRLSSDAGRLIAGDTVALVSATGCDAGDGGDTSGGVDPAGDSTFGSTGGSEAGANSGEDAAPWEIGLGEGSCVLTRSALAMETPRSDEASANLGPSTGMGSVVPFAMPPRDALRVMASQEAGAIVAVAR